ncbi:unnamed protein product, partial [Meganyctiphanes norvegica]
MGMEIPGDCSEESGAGEEGGGDDLIPTGGGGISAASGEEVSPVNNVDDHATTSKGRKPTGGEDGSPMKSLLENSRNCKKETHTVFVDLHNTGRMNHITNPNTYEDLVNNNKYVPESANQPYFNVDNTESFLINGSELSKLNDGNSYENHSFSPYTENYNKSQDKICDNKFNEEKMDDSANKSYEHVDRKAAEEISLNGNSERTPMLENGKNEEEKCPSDITNLTDESVNNKVKVNVLEMVKQIEQGLGETESSENEPMSRAETMTRRERRQLRKRKSERKIGSRGWDITSSDFVTDYPIAIEPDPVQISLPDIQIESNTPPINTEEDQPDSPPTFLVSPIVDETSGNSANSGSIPSSPEYEFNFFPLGSANKNLENNEEQFFCEDNMNSLSLRVLPRTPQGRITPTLGIQEADIPELPEEGQEPLLEPHTPESVLSQASLSGISLLSSDWWMKREHSQEKILPVEYEFQTRKISTTSSNEEAHRQQEQGSRWKNITKK